MNSYELSRAYFDWAFENPEKIKPMHTAIYFFAIEHCNRLGWKSKFGLPTSMAMEAIGVKSYKAYKEALDLLVEEGFITMIEKSRNQHSSNIVALNLKTKATTKALTKALSKHGTKQSQSTDQSDVESNSSIDKPNNLEPLNHERGNQNPPPDSENQFKFPVGKSQNKPTDWNELREFVKTKSQNVGLAPPMVEMLTKEIVDHYADFDRVWRRADQQPILNWQKQIGTQWLTDLKIQEFKNKYLKLHPQQQVASMPKTRNN
jgi:hypothetical protein